jgi:hypothetical protein
MTPRLLRVGARALVIACLSLSTAGVIGGCSASSSKAPDTAAEAQATAMPGPPGQLQYPQAGYPSGDAASPGVTYANPPGTPAGDLDRAEHALDLAIQGQDAAGQPLAAGLDRCNIVCDALASMRRSAEHVCQLDAARCDDAKTRVQRAEERARSACPVCAAPG